MLFALVAILIMGLVSIFRPGALPSWLVRPRSRTYNLLWVSGVGLFAAIAAGGYFASWWRLTSEAHSRAASTASGCVEDFHPSSGLRGDAVEMIKVSGETFTYSDSTETPAFHKTVRDGGPIKPDDWVSITHVGNDIVRLQVAEHACPSAQVDSNWRAT